MLITLGIIGVVAAMTLPALIQHYEKTVLKNQFKKVYSTFSNAIAKTYADNDGIFYECYYADYTSSPCLERDPVTGSCTKYEHVIGYNLNSECPKLYEDLKKILKVVKICENNALKNGCIPQDMKGYEETYKELDPNLSDYDILAATSGCDGFRSSNIKKYNAAWVLGNGTVIGFYRTLPGKIFWVDINGHKKPNKWGHDIFSFQFKGNSHKVKLVDGGCSAPEKGGATTENMIKDMYK